VSLNLCDMKRTKQLVRKKQSIFSIADLIKVLDNKAFNIVEKEFATKCRIDTATGPYFKFLVKEYENGVYATDLDPLIKQIKHMLVQSASYSKG